MNRAQRSNRLFFVFLFFMCTGAQSATDLERLHRLNKDIILLNLINGLYLTETQTTTLIQMIEEAENVRESFREAMEREEKAMSRVLKDLRKILILAGEIPADLIKHIHEMKRVQHELEDSRGDRLLELERNVEALLTPNQRIVVETYKPCTIPPAEGKIGQSVETAAEGIVRLLTHVRRMPGHVYRTTKEMIIDGHLDRVERISGLMESEDKTAWRHMIDTSLEQARTLSNQEFLVRKGKMATQWLPDDRNVNRPRRKNQLGRVGYFFFDPALAEILRSKLEINPSI